MRPACELDIMSVRLTPRHLSQSRPKTKFDQLPSLFISFSDHTSNFYRSG
jgi:hypothetical protein